MSPASNGQWPATVSVAITPTIERDYKARSAFPDLRLESASRVMNGATGIHQLGIEAAETLLKDAEDRLEALGRSPDRAAARGLRYAYATLIDKLQGGIKHAKGLWDDPGLELASRRQQDCLARFEVGDSAQSPDGRVVVVSGYALYVTYDEEGPYVNADNGKRMAYRFGYRARVVATGEVFFWPPHCLQADSEEECSYLRLVVNNSPAQRLNDLFKLRGPFARG